MNRLRVFRYFDSAKIASLKGRAVLAIAMALAFLPRTTFACTVCMGGEESPTAGAINAAIFLMLGCIGSIFAGLGGFAFYLNKRANTPLPPHLQFIDRSDGGEDN